MLTLKDIELMRKFFPSKEDFDDYKQEVNNNILNFKDEILTEIKELRIETEVNSSFRNKIDKQDKRIGRLEVAVFH